MEIEGSGILQSGLRAWRVSFPASLAVIPPSFFSLPLVPGNSPAAPLDKSSVGTPAFTPTAPSTPSPTLALATDSATPPLGSLGHRHNIFSSPSPPPPSTDEIFYREMLEEVKMDMHNSGRHLSKVLPAPPFCVLLSDSHFLRARSCFWLSRNST